jgi:23S rRNA (pseudouridine1915-N3)-methyltransferase
MKIELWSLGSPSVKYLQQGEAEYIKRLQPFCDVSFEVIKTNKIKSQDSNQIMRQEAILILDKLKKNNGTLILLDDKGKEFTSNEFARYVQHHQIHSTKNLIFLIGGSYGFDQSIYEMAQKKISLSKFTFPHQLVRIIFLEQLYRAFSIIQNLPYHHQ